MRIVYRLEHNCIVEIDEKTNEEIHDTKLLGFFKSKIECEEIIPLYSNQPGFIDHPESFAIVEIEANVDDYNECVGEFGSSVYYLSHEFYDGTYDHVSRLGYYSDYLAAEKALKRYQQEPEFSDKQEGFYIAECKIGKREWTEGFFTIESL
jgi:hypothetical protein